VKLSTSAVGIGALLLAVIAAERARAEDDEDLLPGPKTGTIAVAGGVRMTLPFGFLRSADAAGYPLASHTVGPALVLPLGYRIDKEWAVNIDFTYGLDQFNFAASDGKPPSSLRAQTFTLQIGGQYTPQVGWGRLEPVFGFGVGYYLSTLTSTDSALSLKSTESNATGFFVSVGLRYALTSQVGLNLEDRFALATAKAGATLGDVPVGGNTASLGMYYAFRE
jgi:opacity protein-like surface antigen